MVARQICLDGSPRMMFTPLPFQFVCPRPHQMPLVPILNPALLACRSIRTPICALRPLRHLCRIWFMVALSVRAILGMGSCVVNKCTQRNAGHLSRIKYVLPSRILLALQFLDRLCRKVTPLYLSSSISFLKFGIMGSKLCKRLQFPRHVPLQN